MSGCRGFVDSEEVPSRHTCTCQIEERAWELRSTTHPNWNRRSRAGRPLVAAPMVTPVPVVSSDHNKTSNSSTGTDPLFKNVSSIPPQWFRRQSISAPKCRQPLYENILKDGRERGQERVGRLHSMKGTEPSHWFASAFVKAVNKCIWHTTPSASVINLVVSTQGGNWANATGKVIGMTSQMRPGHLTRGSQYRGCGYSVSCLGHDLALLVRNLGSTETSVGQFPEGLHIFDSASAPRGGGLR